MKEKHVPWIEVKRQGEVLRIIVEVGREVSHPNTPEHHIASVCVFFQPQGEEVLLPIGRAEFLGHGEAGYTRPKAEFEFVPKQKGTVVAVSYCNLHGFWVAEKEVGD